MIDTNNSPQDDDYTGHDRDKEMQKCLDSAHTTDQSFFCRMTGGKSLGSKIAKYSDDPAAK